MSQAGLSRIETGRRSVSWSTLVRLLADLDLQPVLGSEPVGANLDRLIDIDRARPALDWWDDLLDGPMLLRMLHELPLTADGSLAARLLGLPVRVREIDLLVDPVHKALPRIAEWLGNRFVGVGAGQDDRTFWAQVGDLLVNLHLLDQPAPCVRIQAPLHFGEPVLAPGTTVAVTPAHLLQLGPDDRRIVERVLNPPIER